jgi:recombinational DNA repair protein RecR
MEFDPHTLHQIIQRISQQMRCPQCGEKVPVDFTCVRLTSDDFVLMQLKCEVCDAYIVLHASLSCIKGVKLEKEDKEKILNASSSLCMREGEVDLLRNALEKASGSFEQLFIESKEVTEKEL